MARISPSLVVASLALAISLGGTGYAAFKLPANSVGPKQLKPGAVTSLKVKDASLLAGDFKPGQLPAGAQGPKGDKGDKGDAGAQGPAGPQGPAGLADLQVVAINSSASSDTFKSVNAACPPGKKVVGGGAYIPGIPPAGGPFITRSAPLSALTGWQAGATEAGAYAGAWQITAYAVCAAVAP